MFNTVMGHTVLNRIKVLLFLLLITSSLILHAEADGPDYWQLRNVEKGAVIIIRQQASINAAEIGRIPYGARCIRNSGCKGGLNFEEFTTLSDVEKQQILKQRPRWCHISYKKYTGWVEGRYLTEGACLEQQEPVRYKQSLPRAVQASTQSS